MTKVKFSAKAGKVSICDDSDITLDNDTSFQTQADSGTATVVSTYAKDLSFTTPEMEIEKIDTAGKDANGFQNAFVNENPSGMAVFSCTLIMQGTELFENSMTEMGAGSSFHEYGYNTDKRSTKSVVANITDGTDTFNAVLKSAYIKFGERKLTGTDGHWEQDIEVKCLPSNYREQFSV